MSWRQPLCEVVYTVKWPSAKTPKQKLGTGRSGCVSTVCGCREGARRFKTATTHLRGTSPLVIRRSIWLEARSGVRFGADYWVSSPNVFVCLDESGTSSLGRRPEFRPSFQIRATRIQGLRPLHQMSLELVSLACGAQLWHTLLLLPKTVCSGFRQKLVAGE